MLPGHYLFCIELSISISYVPTSLSKFKFVIASSSSPVLTSWLCAPYKPAACVMFAALNLILDCPGLELAVAVYRGLFTGRPLPYVLCVPCVPVWSGNVARRPRIYIHYKTTIYSKFA